MNEKSEWQNLRTALNSSYAYNENWEKAIHLFNQRVNNKFISPITKLIHGKAARGEGFSILTIQCALIESFAAFRVGKIFNYNYRRNTDPSYQYKNSKDIFVNFLLDEEVKIFKDNFYTYDSLGVKINNNPFNAENFYSEVRCGLMHEARTKKNWIIKAYKGNGIKTATQFLELENGEIKIYRSVLHYRLKKYLTDYLNELRHNENTGESLRRLFARKLDHLFEFTPDPNNFDWWQDR